MKDAKYSQSDTNDVSKNIVTLKLKSFHDVTLSSLAAPEVTKTTTSDVTTDGKDDDTRFSVNLADCKGGRHVEM